MSMKRLFLFAAYEADGRVSESLIMYVKALSREGDVVLVADSDIEVSQLEQIAPYCLSCQAGRHEEYDFGSYKRAFAWAVSNLDISSYDYLYMVNDSVYGPLYDLSKYLQKMESMGVPAFSFVLNPHKRSPHMQSWFIGLGQGVFLQPWFAGFLASVKKEQDKNQVCVKYETGLSELLTEMCIPYKGLFSVRGKKIYNSVWKLYRSGLPFVKKTAFKRHNGSLGHQLSRMMKKVDPQVRSAILNDAERMYGREYVQWLITSNPLKVSFRYLNYLLRKI